MKSWSWLCWSTGPSADRGRAPAGLAEAFGPQLHIPAGEAFEPIRIGHQYRDRLRFGGGERHIERRADGGRDLSGGTARQHRRKRHGGAAAERGDVEAGHRRRQQADIGQHREAAAHIGVVIEHGDAMAGEKIAQAIAPAGDRRLGDAEEDFWRLCGKAGGAYRRQGRDGLHQRLAGAAGFRYRDETRRGERQPRQHRRVGVGIEIVHEVQARAVAQSAEPRHPATGELRHRLATEARSAGTEKDDV